jgi:hypothetical protein
LFGVYRKPQEGGGSKNPIKLLNKIQEVQRGHKVPLDDGKFLPKKVQSTPFHPKGLIHSNLNARFPGGPKGVDGFPSGHLNLDDGHPCLLKSFH